MIRRSSEKKMLQDAFVRSIFLRYIDEHPETDKRTFFPIYFQQELGISDGYGYLRSLIHQKYLERDPERGIVLTNLGRASIVENHLRFFDFAGPYVTYEEFQEESGQMAEGTTFEVVMLSLLLKKIKTLKEQDNYISVKDAHLDIATLYEELNIPDRAMYHYLVSLYYDVSGLEYYDQLAMFSQGKGERADAETAFNGVCIRPQVISGLRRQKEPCSPQVVDEIFSRESININLCTKANFLQLAEELRSGKYDYTAWRSRFSDAYWNLFLMADKYRKEKSQQ